MIMHFPNKASFLQVRFNRFTLLNACNNYSPNTSRHHASLYTYTDIRVKHQRAYELSLNSHTVPYSLNLYFCGERLTWKEIWMVKLCYIIYKNMLVTISHENSFVTSHTKKHYNISYFIIKHIIMIFIIDMIKLHRTSINHTVDYQCKALKKFGTIIYFVKFS